MISVIIPLYNKSAAVERSVQSVLTQSFSDFELIIVDDGSTDDSLDIVKRIQDDRIVIIEQENGGPSKARNTGVHHAKGEWIVFLDADDELLPDALRHLYEVSIQYPRADIIDGAYKIRSGNVEKLHGRCDGEVKDNYKSFFYRDILPRTGNALFRRILLQKYPYDVRIRRYEDVEFIMRMLKDARIVTTSRPIFVLNAAFSCASKARPSIKEDFMGYMDFRNKGFWERMCLYQFYLGERPYYPQEVRRLYPNLHRRYDLLIIYKLLLLLRRAHVF